MRWRKRGSSLHERFAWLVLRVKPGVTTLELDRIAEETIRQGGGIPAFKGYGGFPGSICASINEQIVHGIPSDAVVLQEGDIISIDTALSLAAGLAIMPGPSLWERSRRRSSACSR